MLIIVNSAGASRPEGTILEKTNPETKSVVMVEAAKDYGSTQIESAVQRSFAALDRRGLTVRPGSRVFVKINTLSPRRNPESAVNTHPAVLREVLRCLLDRRAKPVVGDDVNAGREDPFRIPGQRAVCRELGVKLVNLRKEGFREIPIDGRRLRSVFISRPVLEADLVINVPKLKTHSLTGLTCAVKNMYGVMPAGERLRIHRLFPMNEPFCEALVDIFAAVRPQFQICDAVIAMEGEGPSGGRPRPLGCILAGPDAVALDAVASHLIGIRPLDVATTRIAHERGLGQGDLARIETSGVPLEGLRMADFKHSVVAFSFLRTRLPSSLYAWVQGRLVMTPEIDPSRCSLCRDCIRICPQRTIMERDDKAWIDLSRCIHCLCCHEVCPSKAIRLKRTRFGVLLQAAGAAWERASRLLR